MAIRAVASVNNERKKSRDTGWVRMGVSAWPRLLLVLAPLCLQNTLALAKSSAEEANQQIETRGDDPSEVRSLTILPGFSTPISSPSLLNEFPGRDDGRGNLRWSASDANGISDHIAMADSGTIVAIGYSLNDERLEIRRASNGDSLFAFTVEYGGSHVAVSATGEYIAYSALDSVWVFRWDGQRVTRVFRFGMNGYQPGPVSIDAAGRTFIATGSDPAGVTNRAWGFRVNDGQRLWTLDVDARETFGWYGANISADGNVAAVNGKFRMYVVDAQNGELIFEEPTYNSESPVSLSRDGRILSTGSLSGRVRVFGRVDQGYGELWHYTFNAEAGCWVTASEVSLDGSTVAVGTLDFFEDHYAGRLALFETRGLGRPVWVSEPLADEVAAIDLTPTGSIIAAATWGDVNHELPDLQVFERHSNRPFYNLTTDGSLSAVSMAATGLRLITGGKAVHNRQFGRGGQAHMVDLALLGGFVSGTTRTAGGAAIAGATVGANGSPYQATSDNQGRYTLRVETDEDAAFTIFGSKRGIGYAEEGDIQVRPGQVTNNVILVFADGQVEAPPANLQATQGTRNHIALSWEPYNGRRSIRSYRIEDGVLAATGLAKPLLGLTPWDQVSRDLRLPSRDDADDADSIRIYRSPTAGGPYSRVGAVDAGESRFIDRTVLYPMHRYYYVVAASFGNGESEFSEEVVGWLDDAFLIWDADLQSMPAAPRLDGTINPDEWAGSVVRDISDVFGYDRPDTAGTVTARIGFRDEEDLLYIAVTYHTLRARQQNMGLGVYVDEDGDGAWSWRRPGSEGNYWGYWRNGAPDMRYRSLTGGPYSPDPYYTFENPTLAYGDARGVVEVEMAIPLGFHSTPEIALFAPDYTIGLGLFAMSRDAEQAAIFQGWWPQEMFSIVTEPRQFARVHIPAVLTVPPLAPSRLRVARVRSGLMLNWQDPVVGLDSAQIRGWDRVNVYRNGELRAHVEPGTETWFDDGFRPEGADRGGWYEYVLSGSVADVDSFFEGPRSAPVGAYLGAQPEISELKYDDDSPEAFYVVDFNGADNRFATRFDIEAGWEEVSFYWVEYYHRGDQAIDIYCAPDNGGVPGEGGTRFRVSPNSVEGLYRFHFPGLEQPREELDPDFGGSFWVILNYLPTSPGAPAIGIDASVRDAERNLYYTAASGWRSFDIGQPMIRVGIGQPMSADELPAVLPTEFRIGANYPNPFNGRTVVPVELPANGRLIVTLSDLTGRVVYYENFGEMRAGIQMISINAENLSSGVYIAGVDFGGNEHRMAVHLLK